MIALLMLAMAAGCTREGPLQVYGAPPQTFSIYVGGSIAIQLGTVGPGEYVAPPTLTGSTIEFLGVTSPAVQVPSGVGQIFHFRGVSRGQTIIQFHNTGRSPDVSDTVVVR